MTTPRLELRVERGSASARAIYLDRFGDKWSLVHGIARCTRCGFQVRQHFSSSKPGKFGTCCVTLSARSRRKGPFRPKVDLRPGGRVDRCTRCRRELTRAQSRADGIGHTCRDALSTDNQDELALDDRRTVRLR